jgi:hypothetical protein
MIVVARRGQQRSSVSSFQVLRMATARSPGARFAGVIAVDPALAEILVRAGQAACSYSWRMPPRRSHLGMLRRVIVSGSAIGVGKVVVGGRLQCPDGVGGVVKLLELP